VREGAGGEAQLPLPATFLDSLRELESSYLASDDPIRQSGFGRDYATWRRSREMILDAVDGDGDFLDVGCANGYLLECLVGWAAERGRRLTPYGLDIGAGLIALAKQRFPGRESHFFHANAWEWQPPRRFRFVYTLIDCVPEEFGAVYVARLLDRAVEPGGRLIVGAYGSRSRELRPLPIAALLKGWGHSVVGTAADEAPAWNLVAWVDRPAALSVESAADAGL
jgi:SAM-dependent methyltransferase